MQNDKTYYKRMSQDRIDYPNEVFPFEYHKIQLYSSQNDEGWSVTEVKTGYRIGNICSTQQEAENSAREIVDAHGINPTKQSIKIALANIKQGLIYDVEGKQWQKPMEV